MSKLLGGILLVAGTTIGAGMLALPVVTGLTGFGPSILLFLAYWLFMTFTAFLFLEVTLAFEDHANMNTMAKVTLGRMGEAVSWVAYMFLLYALTTAYLAGGAPLIMEAFNIPKWAASLPLLGVFGYFVYHGTHAVDKMNRILMMGMAIAYGCLIFSLIPEVKLEYLRHTSTEGLFTAMSVIATSFGFHIIIPSLTHYLERDVKKLRLSILVGSAIPLVVYIVWEFFALSIIPLEELRKGFQEGSNGALVLSNWLDKPFISWVANTFSFFAIITSFLGVSLALLDFLADGFKVEKDAKGKMFLCLLTFCPPLFFMLIYPRAFLSALEFAGAFGVVFLLGLIPALMVWRKRYHLHLESPYRAPGGKIALVFVVLFSLCIIGLEIYHKS